MDRGKRVVREWDSSDSMRSDAASNVAPVRRWRQDQEERIRELEAEIMLLRGQRDEADAQYRDHCQWSERTIREMVASFRVEVLQLRGMVTACRARMIQWGQSGIGRLQEELDREISSVYQIEGAVSRIVRGARVPGYPVPAAAAAPVPAASVAVPASTVAPVAPVPPLVGEAISVPAPLAERRVLGETYFGGVLRSDVGPSQAGASRPTRYPRVRRTARKSTIPPPSLVRMIRPARETGPGSGVGSSSSEEEPEEDFEV